MRRTGSALPRQNGTVHRAGKRRRLLGCGGWSWVGGWSRGRALAPDGERRTGEDENPCEQNPASRRQSYHSLLLNP